MNSNTFIPDETLIHIFEYLRVRDIKSCRLVCPRWYSCCNAWSIRRNEKYVFRSAILTSTEINDILLNHAGTNLSVELRGVILDRLRFDKFGRKIQTLRIKRCFFDSLTNIFLSTPNMKSFIVDDGGTHLGELTMDLQRKRSVINNLEKLEYVCLFGLNRVSSFKNDPFSFIGSLSSIFPRLKSISLPHLRRFSFDEHYLECLVVKNDFRELRNFFVALPLRYSLESLPKLRVLKIELEGTLDLDLQFFSQQNCLEELILMRHCYSNELGRDDLKRLLLHILTNCKRLKVLHFKMSHLHLNRTDLPEFTKAIATIESITHLGLGLRFEPNTLGPFFALFTGLKYLDVWIDSEGGVTPWEFCQTISEILQSQKGQQIVMRTYTHSRELYNNDIDPELMPNIQNSPNVIEGPRDDKLEDLQVDMCLPNKTVIYFFISWRFPNLLVLKLAGSLPDITGPVIGLEDKNEFIHWIHTMPLLRKIYIQWVELDTDQCQTICCKLPNLERITYRGLRPPDQIEVRELFTKCPALKKVEFLKHDIRTLCLFRWQYFVNRLKNLIYIREKELTIYIPYTSMV